MSNSNTAMSAGALAAALPPSPLSQGSEDLIQSLHALMHTADELHGVFAPVLNGARVAPLSPPSNKECDRLQTSSHVQFLNEARLLVLAIHARLNDLRSASETI